MISRELDYFEVLYRRYNNPLYIHPDPLELVRGYSSREDREIAGLICSTLALGRVSAILKACSSVLAAVPSPRRDLLSNGVATIRRRLRGFVYRFFSEEDMVRLLSGIAEVVHTFGSLEACFLHRSQGEGSDTLGRQDRLEHFVTAVREAAGPLPPILLPSPARGSACKRLHLFLRWMVRSDSVDLGVWEAVSPGSLEVPVDTHMLKVARHLGITERRQADAKTSREITAYFSGIQPNDPVRYDFALTRAGISGREAIREAVYDSEFRVRSPQ